ncbi:MAG: Rrf2 family transcriptional regulator [Desulfovibrio sp.]|jgi:Rrf2 family protein|nr:Rrf2 family transcriptional regulator [Desulfovibrio sp.]MBQ1539503.1 Rrf2 family transcriptional regulator [Desulfovibrio sp.]MCR5170152.1 Rrf2 family transcriptional regulator [Desulfovibrio sp.]
MRLSVQTRYAARILLFLTHHSASSPASAQKISQKTGISQQFAEKILRKLRILGLTDSVRGANGGYYLRLSPSNITFGCLVDLMEGGFTLKCKKDNEVCANSEECPLKKSFEKMEEEVYSVLNNITLEDFLDSQKDALLGAEEKDPQTRDEA